MSYIDLLILIPIVWGCIRGFMKGLVIELATLAGLILGIIASFYFASDLGELLRQYFSFGASAARIIASILIFTGVMLIAWLIGKAIEKTVELIALGWLNKLLGAVVGIVKGAVVAALLLYVVVYFDTGENIISRTEKEKSMFYQAASRIIPALVPNVSRGAAFVPGQ
jgi:membrane protein required for colicin V production